MAAPIININSNSNGEYESINNKTRLRNELTNLYGGNNGFLSNREINGFVKNLGYNGSNTLKPFELHA